MQDYLKYELVTLEQVKSILNDAFPNLDFSDLKAVKFVGDGTYFEFTTKFVEIRPSGTDAKTKSYAAGENKEELEKFTKMMGNFAGKRTELYETLITKEFYKSSKDLATKYYANFMAKD